MLLNRQQLQITWDAIDKERRNSPSKEHVRQLQEIQDELLIEMNLDTRIREIGRERSGD